MCVIQVYGIFTRKQMLKQQIIKGINDDAFINIPCMREGGEVVVFLGRLLKGLRDEDFVVLGQFWAKVITWCL